MAAKRKYILFLKSKGFTLMEVLVVVVIIGLLAGIVISSLNSAKESAHVVSAGMQQRQIKMGVEMYFNDMGFYPPDVTRGWDPGLVRPFPWNPDQEVGETVSGPNTDCSHCPLDWESIVDVYWSGPYIPSWPRFTPWRGKYDYNYWEEEIIRNECVVPPGIYIGVQGDYNNENTIPLSAEEKMIIKGFDYEQCINGESQMLLWLLE